MNPRTRVKNLKTKVIYVHSFKVSSLKLYTNYKEKIVTFLDIERARAREKEREEGVKKDRKKRTRKKKKKEWKGRKREVLHFFHQIKSMSK